MMMRSFIFLSAFLAAGCGKENACQELADAMCECDDTYCDAEVKEDPTDDELERCEVMLDDFECGGDTGGM